MQAVPRPPLRLLHLPATLWAGPGSCTSTIYAVQLVCQSVHPAASEPAVCCMNVDQQTGDRQSERFRGMDPAMLALLPPHMVAEVLAQLQPKSAAVVAAAGTADGNGEKAKRKTPVETEEAGTSLLEETAEVFAGYIPSIGIGKPHPSPIVESGLLSSVRLPPLIYPHDGIPAATIESGKLSSLQLEAILHAGQRHLLVKNGRRAGFFLGDGTGVGKGRQLSGILLDNVARGRKKHLWISTSGDLKNEASNDFADIGASGVLVKDMNDLDKAQGALGWSPEFKDPPGGMVLFLTYSMLTSSKRANKAGGKVSRLEQVIEWLSDGKPERYEGCLCLDESHRAKSFKGADSEASSKMSKAVIELQSRLPRARLVYASATGIESLEHMAYAERIMLWGNPSFGTFDSFQKTLLKRGLGALEMLAVELKLSASFVARSLSWEGAEFQIDSCAIKDAQRELYAQCSRFFFRLKAELQQACDACNAPGGANSPMKMLWGLQQRFFRNLIDSFKVDFIVSETERALAEGFCVVIGLQSTGEAGMEKALEGKHHHAYGGGMRTDHMVSATKECLKAFISQYFPTKQSHKAVRIPSIEEIQQRAVEYAERGMTFDLESQLREREAAVAAEESASTEIVELVDMVEMRDALLDEVQAMDLPPSPLDAIIDRLGGPKKVSEMTGRKGRLVRCSHISKGTDNGFIYESRELPSKGPSLGDAVETINVKEREEFMAGKKLVAVISDAASTGISLHASLLQSKGNQRRRIHMTLELSFSADKTLQQLGRTHRAHQSSAPVFRLITTTFGGEKRFASAVAKKLLSLGALTRGDRRAASGMDFSSFSLDTKAGATALRRMIDFLDHPSDVSETNVLNYCGDDELCAVPGVDMTNAGAVLACAKTAIDKLCLSDGTQPPTVKRFLNRILALPEGEQNLLFRLFTCELDAVIADQRKAGTYDEGVVDLRASSIFTVKDPQLVYKDEATNAVCEAETVCLDRGVSFDEALQIYNEALEDDPESGVAFYESRRETYGRRFYLLAVPKITAPDLVYVTRANTGRNPFDVRLDELETTNRRLSDPEHAKAGWDSIFQETEDRCIHGRNCKTIGCAQGSRKQHTKLITGAIVPVWQALESTMVQHRADVTKAEAQLRVVRVGLDDGRRLVGIRFPNQEHILDYLIKTTKDLITKHAASATGQSLVEAVTPINHTVLKKATTAKRTMESFFGPAGKKSKP